MFTECSPNECLFVPAACLSFIESGEEGQDSFLDAQLLHIVPLIDYFHQFNPGQLCNDNGNVLLAVALMIILTIERLLCGQTLSLAMKINTLRSVRVILI